MNRPFYWDDISDANKARVIAFYNWFTCYLNMYLCTAIIAVTIYSGALVLFHFMIGFPLWLAIISAIMMVLISWLYLHMCKFLYWQDGYGYGHDAGLEENVEILEASDD